MRRAQVGLFQDERDEEQRRQRSAQNGAAPVVHLVHACLQKVGEEQNQRGLGQLRRLKAEAPPKRIQRCVLCESRMAKTASSSSVVTATAGKTTRGLL